MKAVVGAGKKRSVATIMTDEATKKSRLFRSSVAIDIGLILRVVW
jgi:hypothetical protein